MNTSRDTWRQLSGASVSVVLEVEGTRACVVRICHSRTRAAVFCSCRARGPWMQLSVFRQVGVRRPRGLSWVQGVIATEVRAGMRKRSSTTSVPGRTTCAQRAGAAAFEREQLASVTHSPALGVCTRTIGPGRGAGSRRRGLRRAGTRRQAQPRVECSGHFQWSATRGGCFPRGGLRPPLACPIH